MAVEFSRRALADLDAIASYYSGHAGPRIAALIKARIREVVARIASAPESARQVEDRPDVRVLPVIRYPFKIFYTFAAGRLIILHIRHTSRRPWEGKQ